jgi:hypothetical protein
MHFCFLEVYAVYDRSKEAHSEEKKYRRVLKNDHRSTSGCLSICALRMALCMFARVLLVSAVTRISLTRKFVVCMLRWRVNDNQPACSTKLVDKLVEVALNVLTP